MIVAFLAAAALGQWSNSGWADSPLSPQPRSWASDPFARDPLPSRFRTATVRRAVTEVPKPVRPVPQRLDDLEWTVGQLVIDEPKDWRPEVRLAAAPPPAPPAVRSEVKAPMPPPGVLGRIDIAPLIERLDRIEARLAEVLARLEAHAAKAPVAAAPCNPDTCHCATSGVCVNPASCSCPNCPAKRAPARMPAAATMPPRTVTVMTDRHGRLWDDSVSGYDGLVRWVQQQDAAYAAPQPYFALPQGGGFSAGSVCGPGGGGPAAGFGRGLFGGLFR